MRRRGGGLRQGWAWLISALLMCSVVALDVVGPRPVFGCSIALAEVEFDAVVVAVDGETVTYRVLRTRDWPDYDGPRPVEGAEVQVAYPRWASILDVGERYRVRGWGGTSGIESQIAFDYEGDCGSGAGTTAIDGSLLATPQGLDRHLPKALGLGAVLVGAILLVHRMVTRRADATT